MAIQTIHTMEFILQKGDYGIKMRLKIVMVIGFIIEVMIIGHQSINIIFFIILSHCKIKQIKVMEDTLLIHLHSLTISIMILTDNYCLCVQPQIVLSNILHQVQLKWDNHK